MELITVDPRSILIPEVRITNAMDPELSAMLAESLRVMGQTAPIVCVRTKEGLVLVDGLHRLNEAIAQGWPTIQAAVQDGELSDVLLRNLAMSHLVGKPKAGDLVRVIRELTSESGLDSDAIAARTGMSRQRIEELWTIAETDPEILAGLDDGYLTVGHAYALARVRDPEVRLRIFDQQRALRWTVQQLRDHIKAVEAIARSPAAVQPIPPPQQTVHINCHFCGSTEAAHKVQHLPLCESCIGDMAALVRQARAPSAQGVS